MAKKKRKVVKPWCWYCERDFEDDTILINHQRSKHFKCPTCNRRLQTIGGLVVHMETVHKELLTRVPNAVAGRETTEIEIFGMEGVPLEDLQAHESKILDQQEASNKKSKVDLISPTSTLPSPLEAASSLISSLASASEPPAASSSNAVTPSASVVRTMPPPPAVPGFLPPPPLPMGMGHPSLNGMPPPHPPPPPMGMAPPPLNAYPPMPPPNMGMMPPFLGYPPPPAGFMPPMGMPPMPPMGMPPMGMPPMSSLPPVPVWQQQASSQSVVAATPNVTTPAAAATTATTTTAAAPTIAGTEVKVHLVYSDQGVSPEEKRAAARHGVPVI